jgi:hypothetical protein
VTAERWTLADGARFVAEHAEWARRHGFMLALYGSTLTGSGRDLDVFAIPWRPADPVAFARGFAALVGGSIEEEGPGVQCYSAAIRVGRRIVDLQARPFAPFTPGSETP